MILTRRTFVQTSLAASLALAAEATRTNWLLSPADPIRVGIAGLGPSASEHLALFAAVPGARITHLADNSSTNLAAAVSQLKDLGQPVPLVSRSMDALLADSSLGAFSWPYQVIDEGSTLRRILARGLPVLADVLPPSASLPVSSFAKFSQLHLRVADFMYPGAALDIYAWSKRNAADSTAGTRPTAQLTLERRLVPGEIRAVLISTVYALLVAQALPASELMRWSQAADTIELTTVNSRARINMPDHTLGAKCLTIGLLPRTSSASVLSLHHNKGSLEVPVWRQPDAQTSLRTVMHFLNSVRTEACTSQTLDSALAASSLVDRLFRSLEITS